MTPVYLFPPRTRRRRGYSTSPRQRAAGPPHLHVVYQQGAPSSSRRGESPMVPGPDCMEDGRKCPNGIHHAARSVSAWRYVGVHCHGSEQCHVSTLYWTHHMTHQLKWNNCAGCMRKRSLLSRCPTYFRKAAHLNGHRLVSMKLKLRPKKRPMI